MNKKVTSLGVMKENELNAWGVGVGVGGLHFGSLSK